MSEIREWEEGEEAAYVEVAELLFGESEHTPENVVNGVRQLLCELDSLRDWQEGAVAALMISYPPGMPPHTEDVYYAHKSYYTSRSEDYRLGADEVAAAILSVKERMEQGRGEQHLAGGGTTPSTPPCTPPSPCEMCNGVGFYVSLPGDVITPCPGCSEDCGATGHEGEK